MDSVIITAPNLTNWENTLEGYKMSLLNTAAGNTKIMKSQKGTEIRIASLSLMPDSTICPSSTLAQCFKPCLKFAGRGIMSNVAGGRQSKSDYWHNDRAGFLKQLRQEIRNFIVLCNKQNKQAAFRLNTISDISWERYGIPQEFPGAIFYDYTKSASRLHKLPNNYELIFSYSGAPKYQAQVQRALKTQAPIAVVFRGHVPAGKYFLGREIVDGDASDLKNLKYRGKIVGLKLKGNNKTQKTKSPFVVEPGAAQDCIEIAA